MPGRFTIRLVVCALVLVAVLSACGSETTEPPAEPTAVTVQESSPVQPRIAQEPVAVVPGIGVLAPVGGNRTAEDEATPTPEPTDIAEPTEVTEEAEPTEASASSDAITQTLSTMAPLPTRAPVQPPAVVALPTQPPAQVVSTSALTILDDETPAPPLTVIVSMNREFEGYRFGISGLVRNDATEPYTALGMNATFFRDDGSRFGPIKINVQCPILEPGDSCPFMLEAIDKGITQVMLHPDGRPTERRTVPVEVRGVSHYQDTLGYVHITGSVVNTNPVAVRDVTVTGALIDGRGEIVSTGVALLVQTIEAGASAPFDVLIRHAPYSQTQLFVQALPAPQ